MRVHFLLSNNLTPCSYNPSYEGKGKEPCVGDSDLVTCPDCQLNVSMILNCSIAVGKELERNAKELTRLQKAMIVLSGR